MRFGSPAAVSVPSCPPWVVAPDLGVYVFPAPRGEPRVERYLVAKAVSGFFLLPFSPFVLGPLRPTEPVAGALSHDADVA